MRSGTGNRTERTGQCTAATRSFVQDGAQVVRSIERNRKVVSQHWLSHRCQRLADDGGDNCNGSDERTVKRVRVEGSINVADTTERKEENVPAVRFAVSVDKSGACSEMCDGCTTGCHDRTSDERWEVA